MNMAVMLCFIIRCTGFYGFDLHTRVGHNALIAVEY